MSEKENTTDPILQIFRITERLGFFNFQEAKDKGATNRQALNTSLSGAATQGALMNLANMTPHPIARTALYQFYVNYRRTAEEQLCSCFCCSTRIFVELVHFRVHRMSGIQLLPY